MKEEKAKKGPLVSK